MKKQAVFFCLILSAGLVHAGPKKRSTAGAPARIHTTCESKEAKIEIDFGHALATNYLTEKDFEFSIGGTRKKLPSEAIKQYKYENSELFMIIDAVALDPDFKVSYRLSVKNGKGNIRAFSRSHQEPASSVTCTLYQ